MAAVVAGSLFCANAEESYAPKAGDFSTEINFAPFAQNGNVFSMPALQARYFLTNKDAVTLELGLNGTNNKEVANTEVSNAFNSSYNGTFSLDLGYQRMLYTAKRINIYGGAKFGYFRDFVAASSQTDDNNKVWANYIAGVNGQPGKYTANGIELYAVAGMDFYCYKGLFVGLEMNLGFRDAFAVNTNKKITVAGQTTEQKSHAGGHSFEGGFNVEPKFRLGYTF